MKGLRIEIRVKLTHHLHHPIGFVSFSGAGGAGSGYVPMSEETRERDDLANHPKLKVTRLLHKSLRHMTELAGRDTSDGSEAWFDLLHQSAIEVKAIEMRVSQSLGLSITPKGTSS